MEMADVTIEAKFPHGAKGADVRLRLKIEQALDGASLTIEDWDGNTVTIGTDGITIPQFLAACAELYSRYQAATQPIVLEAKQ